MATAGYLTQSYPVQTRSRELWWTPHLLIISAIVFNAILCLVNTHVTGITNKTVILSEVLIICATVAVCYKSLNMLYVFVLAGTIFLCLTLALIRVSLSPDAGLDVKIARDLLLPVVFFLLGQRTGNLRCADSVVRISLLLIVAFALFEYFSLDGFLKVFGVAQYYVARGTLEESNWAYSVAHGLMASGIRPPEQGRGLLSFLGDHRVSSLFLEPIGLGNYGCIVAMWAVVRSRMERKFYGWSFFAAVAMILLSDTRFDAYFLPLGILLVLMSPQLSTFFVTGLPVIVPSVLIFLYFEYASEMLDTPSVGGLSTMDRLLYSGRVLAEFDLYNWLGIKVSALQTFDAGYGYLISNAGIFGTVLFWGIFLVLKGANPHFYALRNASVAYFAALFCVSASQLTIKTAALEWFLLGVLSVALSHGRRFVAKPAVAEQEAAAP